MSSKKIFITISVSLLCCFGIAQGKIIYVDDDAAGLDDGTSWQNAFNYLQDALAAALDGDEIHVAQGIYTPDLGFTPDVNKPVEVRYRFATFKLINNVTILGGFAGIVGDSPDKRDIETYPTILSGDLNFDDIDVNSLQDLEEDSARAENCYHVVTGSGTNETAILDGFIITGGNATESRSKSWGGIEPMQGGGMYCYQGSPRIKNCTFIANTAIDNGGGIYCNQGDPYFHNCIFLYNQAAENGGGLYSSQGDLNLSECFFISNKAIEGGGIYKTGTSTSLLTGCTFQSNSADSGCGIYSDTTNLIMRDCSFVDNHAQTSEGGGLYSTQSDLDLAGCTFKANYANDGGGIFNRYGDVNLVDCSFIRNSSYNSGGGIYSLQPSKALLTNCSFMANSAYISGGGICLETSPSATGPGLQNCLFAGNNARSGGGIYFSGSNDLLLTNCTSSWDSAHDGDFLESEQLIQGTINIINSIVWNSDNPIRVVEPPIHSTTISVLFSNIQGGWLGQGNIDEDPLFVDPLGPDLIGGTEDDDLRLSPVSPCVDSGQLSYEPVFFETDLDGNPRVFGSNIDMGAYEFQGKIYVDDDAPYEYPSGSGPFEDGTRNHPFSTIQQAINIAENGYKILVLPGLYNKINFQGKEIIVSGTEGAAVIEAVPNALTDSLLQDAVTFHTGEGPGSVLKNFIIRNSGMAISLDSGSSPTIQNITFIDNNFGIAAYEDSNPDIRNCIFWNNRDGDLFNCQAWYSSLNGGKIENGNLSANPLFVDEANGDYHLKSQGWRWNEQGQSWTWDDITSLCIDAGDPCSPLGDEPISIPRDPNNLYGMNLWINMGAYGGTSQASMAPTDWIRIDITPPSPDPAQWAPDGRPQYIGPLRISSYCLMEAEQVTDESGYVEYFFECTTNPVFNSGWQSSPTYKVLVGNIWQNLRFRVKARDLYLNETGWSEEVLAEE